MKHIFLSLIIVALLTFFVVACNENSTNAAPSLANPSSGAQSTTPPSNTVYMNDSQFEQNHLTITKGSTVTLIDTSPASHVIANGAWGSNGIATYHVEKGAPGENIQFSGNDRHTLGPFTTTGTFHFYCTVHQGMNLTIIVT
jgi:plastocyanin